jgi:hypothetical protein
MFTYLNIFKYLTRFIPGNAHVEGLSIWEAYWGPGELDGDQTKAKEHRFYPGSAPSKGKRPTSCLSDFVLMMWW